MKKKKIDIASLTMCIICFIAVIMKSFVIVMENRISPMEHIRAGTALGSTYWGLTAMIFALFILSMWKDNSEKKNFITGLWASFCFSGAIFFSGLAANHLMEGHDKTYRVTFGIGVYLILFACYGVIVKCNEHIKTSWKRVMTTFLGIVIIIILFQTGWMDNMSIMTEYFSRYEKFHQVLWEHLSICGIVMSSSILAGIPIGYICYRCKAADTIIMGFLNIVRSVPSIALITLMVTPLSLLKRIPLFERLGIGSFGFTPVFCALFLYALFQIVNSMSNALKTIDVNYLKTARAMGMTEKTIMFKVQIPMILPVLVSGVRVAIISTFTAASLGTMVGFGGLGTFIRMGSGGAVALDLILLGAVPIMIMIFITDFIFTRLSSWLEKRLTGGIR